MALLENKIGMTSAPVTDAVSAKAVKFGVGLDDGLHKEPGISIVESEMTSCSFPSGPNFNPDEDRAPLENEVSVEPILLKRAASNEDVTSETGLDHE